MLHVQRIYGHLFNLCWDTLLDLINRAIDRAGTGSLEDSIQLMSDPFNLTLGIFRGTHLRGILIVAPTIVPGLTKTGATIYLISLYPDIRLKDVYKMLKDYIQQWAAQLNISILVASTPRSKFYNILQKLDKWQKIEIVTLSLGEVD